MFSIQILAGMRTYVLCIAVSAIMVSALVVTATVVYAHGEDGNTYTIVMNDEGYDPTDIEIAVGDTIEFKNEGSLARWPASNIHPTHSVYPGTHIDNCSEEMTEEMFDACDELTTGESFSFTFTEPGNWRYHDHITPELNGQISVVGDKVEEPIRLHEQITNTVRDWWQQLQMRWRVYQVQQSSSLEKYAVVDVAGDYDQLELLIRAFGAQAVMERLLVETDGGSVIDCHTEAHEVGRMAYQVYGAEVFETGDESCHSGFYHGAMESFIAEKGTADMAGSIEELCSIFDTTFGLFECLHGVGHGVMAYEDYNLPHALDVCDELSTSFARTSCYGGAFMENVVVAQGGVSVPGHSTTWISDTDMHYPCNEMLDNETRAEQCYMMQTSWMLYQNDYDFSVVADECEQAPASMQDACFVSLGRDAAGHTLRDPQSINEICAYTETNQENYNSCVRGAVNVIIDFWGAKHTDQAQQYCEQVPNSVGQEQCNEIVEYRLEEIFTN